ncbi:MAG: hypothetical protein MZV70_65555 [Desulfobacterales bacterium]|nr:hypothetical protein [Desulfobacterales bacterium]
MITRVAVVVRQARTPGASDRQSSWAPAGAKHQALVVPVPAAAGGLAGSRAWDGGDAARARGRPGDAHDHGRQLGRRQRREALAIRA